MQEFIRRIKPWMLVIAMGCGVLFHNWIGYLAFLSPWLIFVMLLITYCRISWRNFRLDGSMWWLLAVQICGSVAIYFLLLLTGLNRDVAQSVFICIICPTATAAPVITRMLGGSIEKVTAYSLLCNLAVAFLAPAIFALILDNPAANSVAQAPSIADMLLRIAGSVIPLLLGPLAVAIILKSLAPKVQHTLASHQGIAFYVWAFSLIIVVGNSVGFIIKEPVSAVPEMLLMALLSFIACVVQFAVGKRIGAKYGDAIAGGQSLGQKNTVLAIWLALAYFNPIVSVGPACYVAWHNIVNSRQIYRHNKQIAA